MKADVWKGSLPERTKAAAFLGGDGAFSSGADQVESRSHSKLALMASLLSVAQLKALDHFCDN